MSKDITDVSQLLKFVALADERRGVGAVKRDRIAQQPTFQGYLYRRLDGRDGDDIQDLACDVWAYRRNLARLRSRDKVAEYFRKWNLWRDMERTAIKAWELYKQEV